MEPACWPVGQLAHKRIGVDFILVCNKLWGVVPPEKPRMRLTCMSEHTVRHNRSAASTCTGCHRRGHRYRRHTGSHGSPAAPDMAACCRCDSGRSRRDSCPVYCSDAFAAWCRHRRCANMLTTPTKLTTDQSQSRCPSSQLIQHQCCPLNVSVAAIEG